MLKTATKSSNITPDDLARSLIQFSRSDTGNCLTFPIESYQVFRLATFLFKTIPFVKSYEDIPVHLLDEIARNFRLTPILKEEIFEKTEKGYSLEGSGFCDMENRVMLSIRVGETDSGVFLNPADTGDDSSSSLVRVSLFYVPLNNKFQKDLLTQLESAATSDYKQRIRKSHINFLCFDRYYKLKNVKVNRKAEINLDLNYGPDFIKVHDHLIKFLHSDETGLAILFGEPGVGKTFFLRFLLTELQRKVIYIPPNLIARVGEPDFLSFLLTQKDFILVIEDAEEIVTNRQDSGNVSAVSNLLNLSDGILGDCIKAKVICTFNTEIKKIDPALLRKGRLKIEHEFGKLKPEYANRLLKHLGVQHVAPEPMSLSDIYGFSEENFRKEKVVSPIGFGK